MEDIDTLMEDNINNIPVHCAFDEMISIEDLKPNPRNPNQHPKKQIKRLAKIIEKQGWRAPISVSNRSKFIVRGHGRYKAAQLLKAIQVPVDRQDYTSDAEEWADLIADNRIAELAEKDDDLLKIVMEEIRIAPVDFELTGFSFKEIDNLLNTTTNKDNEERIVETYQILIECKSEIEQQNLLQRFNAENIQCRALIS